MGLSMSHNSPLGTKRRTLYRRVTDAADTDRPQPIMTLAVGGSVLKLKAAKVPRGPRPNGRRQKITHFSAQSRGRLLELLASINQAACPRLPLFITLTYPSVYPASGEAVKRHLDMMLKRIKREFPQSAAIWKLEYQRRGAPHFHMLLFGVPFLSRYWLSKCWFDVVQSNDERHLKAGTRVEFIKSWRGVMWYAGKYVAKVDVGEGQEGCGRFWGVMARELLPIEIIEVVLTFGAFFRGRRVARRLLKGRNKDQVRKATYNKEGKIPKRPGYVPSLRSETQGLKVFGSYASLAQLARCFT